MRFSHKGGEKVFVDYAGQTIPIVDPETGEVPEVQIFVSVLGASNYTYAEAHESQELPNWIGAHVRMFEFFGGAPKIVAPDNLKAGGKHPCRYEPDLNPTDHDLAQHYGITVIPTRSRKPKDKAKAEMGVQTNSRRGKRPASTSTTISNSKSTTKMSLPTICCTSTSIPHLGKDQVRAFLQALKAKGYQPRVIVTDMNQDYTELVRTVFPRLFITNASSTPCKAHNG